MKRIICFTLCLITVMVGFSTPLTVSASNNSAANQCFDAAYYAEQNPDVVSSVGTNANKLFEHYMQFGRLEGRAASAEFNMLGYRAANPDLNDAFGNNWDSYAVHYKNHGKAEGRNGLGNPSVPIIPVINNTATARPLIYEMEGIAKGRTDIGTTYVEIDLSAQYLYVFVDGVVVLETEIVTGHAKRSPTPAGIFKISYKTTDAVLRGDDYAIPVKYWMPFNGNIGAHDATWRKKFGGQVYVSDGSRGCINMPYSKAEEMYHIVYTGMPVICH